MYNETDVLDALARVIKKHGNYTNNNVTIGDHKVLSRGVATAVVIDGGPIDSPRDTKYGYMAGVQSTYSPVVYVYRKYTEDAESRENLRNDVQNVRETIDGYHRLDGYAESSKAVSASAPLYIGDASGNGPFFVARRLTVSIVRIEDFENLE